MAETLHQLRLVVYPIIYMVWHIPGDESPIIYRVLYIPGGESPIIYRVLYIPGGESPIIYRVLYIPGGESPIIFKVLASSKRWFSRRISEPSSQYCQFTKKLRRIIQHLNSTGSQSFVDLGGGSGWLSTLVF